MTTLHLAAFLPVTQTLGPGYRSAIWVQGCALRCPGCISPEWQPLKGGYDMQTTDLAQLILRQKNIQGITLSGGEPTLQAPALADLLHQVKARKDLDVICFSGYSLETLIHQIPQRHGLSDLLDQIDLLIDNPYIERFNNNTGLRGSSNQRFHFLSSRLKGINFSTLPRSNEIFITNDGFFMAGIPSRQLESGLTQAKQLISEWANRKVNHECT